MKNLDSLKLFTCFNLGSYFGLIFTSLSLCLATTGCQTMKSLWGTDKPTNSEAQGLGDASSKSQDVSALGSNSQNDSENLKYSDTSQMPTAIDRQYKRMNRTRLEEESELQSGAGSLWVMDGQQSYLFAQNKIRREGDVLGIKLDGRALKQVEVKVSIIKKLLKQLQEEEKRADEIRKQRLAQAAEAKDADKATDGTPDRAPAGVVAAKEATPKLPEIKPEKEEKEDLSEIQTISSRIVERLPDGNYKIKGVQPFMIGPKEYKVIVSGVIRPEDYNDEGVSSSKLLDPQFDVLSVRRRSRDDKTTEI